MRYVDVACFPSRFVSLRYHQPDYKAQPTSPANHNLRVVIRALSTLSKPLTLIMEGSLDTGNSIREEGGEQISKSVLTQIAYTHYWIVPIQISGEIVTRSVIGNQKRE